MNQCFRMYSFYCRSEHNIADDFLSRASTEEIPPMGFGPERDTG